MKKVVFLVLAALILLSACSRTEKEPEIKSADSLESVDYERSFSGCRDRYFAVVAAMKTKVGILEREHNKAIKRENETDFFLRDDYILFPFDPFRLESFKITDAFNADVTKENAAEVFEFGGDGFDVSYDSDGETFFVFKLVSEESTKEYKAEYSPGDDSFRYALAVDDAGGSRVEEFLEFSRDKDGVYVIQSRSSRCRIEFDPKGKIVSFVCGELKNGEFSLDESVYPVPDASVDMRWVLSKGKINFSSVRSFENGVLTSEGLGSGSWTSVKIKQSDYESAFYT